MNRMRGMLEDEMTQKRNEKLKQMQDENKRLALEKKQREHKWKVEQENLNQKEITDPNFN
jgi:ribosomal protein L4